jgi:hypothetical protein
MQMHKKTVHFQTLPISIILRLISIKFETLKPPMLQSPHILITKSDDIICNYTKSAKLAMASAVVLSFITGKELPTV